MDAVSSPAFIRAAEAFSPTPPPQPGSPRGRALFGTDGYEVIADALRRQEEVAAEVRQQVLNAEDGRVRRAARRDILTEMLRFYAVVHTEEKLALQSLSENLDFVAQAIRDRHTALRSEGKQRYMFPGHRDEYEGEWKSSTFNGFGAWQHRYNNTDREAYDDLEYEGEWFLGIRNGTGTLSWPRFGLRYYGSWSDGRRHGHGELMDQWGIYRGEFRDNTFQGAGEMRFTDGHVYDGEWLHGRFHGAGTYTDPSKTEYTGSFERGVAHGADGRIVYPDGEQYEGEFKGGKPHGVGRYVAPSFTYDGEWERGSRSGLGTLTVTIDGSTYSGSFLRGKPHGKGTYTGADNTIYDGQWEEGKRHGFGKYIGRRGEVAYAGEWRDDKKHGQGRLALSTVGVVSGTWCGDALHGAAELRPTTTNPDDAAPVRQLVFEHGVCRSSNAPHPVTVAQLDLTRDVNHIVACTVQPLDVPPPLG